jgi:hypothetical protein
MKRFLLLTLLLVSPGVSACALFRPGPEGVDLAKVADEIEIYRKDIELASALAKPETQAKLMQLDRQVVELQRVLRLAATGGPITDVKSAALAALKIASELVSVEGDLKFYLTAAMIFLNHVSAGQMQAASSAAGAQPAV